jgi:hypothetical protein
VHGRKRRERAEGVTAYIAGDVELKLGKNGIKAAM